MKKRHAYLINVIWAEEDGCYLAEVPELEGCVTSGKTAVEAVRHAEDAIESWILAAKRLKHPVPEPALKRKVSGKFNVRLPKAVHKSLIIKALQDGVSLNQMVTTLLAKAT